MPQIPYNQPIGLSYSHIGTATTTVVKGTSGYMDRIIYNGGSSGATLTLYDNTSATGTTIAVVTLSASENNPGAVVYNVNFKVGLTIVSTGTVDVTVVFK